jgi:hypothetical protein
MPTFRNTLFHLHRRVDMKYTTYAEESPRQKAYDNFIIYILLLHFHRYRIRGGADKSLARPTSRCCRTESVVSLERGVWSWTELQVFFITEPERKHVRWCARFQQHLGWARDLSASPRNNWAAANCEHNCKDTGLLDWRFKQTSCTFPYQKRMTNAVSKKPLISDCDVLVHSFEL